MTMSDRMPALQRSSVLFSRRYQLNWRDKNKELVRAVPSREQV